MQPCSRLDVEKSTPVVYASRWLTARALIGVSEVGDAATDDDDGVDRIHFCKARGFSAMAA